MISLVEDIVNYTGFLHACGFSVSVHGNFLSPFIGDLAKYNIHSNPYCLKVKENIDVWKKCIDCQNNVFAHLDDGPFFGMCWTGVEEFVFPVTRDGKAVGFVSVSGYGVNKQKALHKISKFASEFGYFKSDMETAWDNLLVHELPKKERVFTLVKPLVRMFELLEEYRFSLYGELKDGTGAENFVFSRIIDYLHLNYSRKILLSEISAALNCSVSYISHTFKKNTGVNVNTYVNNLRLEAAKRMLKETDLSISEIADITGFADANYFSNSFKKSVGIAPTAFRNFNKDKQ